MQIDSSASRTCMAFASAVECTATERIPISRQARTMRSAISPRLAMRILWNTSGSGDQIFVDHERVSDQQQRLAVLDGHAAGDEQPLDAAGPMRLDRVEHLHRLDEQHCVAPRPLI